MSDKLQEIQPDMYMNYTVTPLSRLIDIDWH